MLAKLSDIRRYEQSFKMRCQFCATGSVRENLTVGDLAVRHIGYDANPDQIAVTFGIMGHGGEFCFVLCVISILYALRLHNKQVLRRSDLMNDDIRTDCTKCLDFILKAIGQHFDLLFSAIPLGIYVPVRKPHLHERAKMGRDSLFTGIGGPQPFVAQKFPQCPRELG